MYTQYLRQQECFLIFFKSNKKKDPPLGRFRRQRRRPRVPPPQVLPWGLILFLLPAPLLDRPRLQLWLAPPARGRRRARGGGRGGRRQQGVHCRHGECMLHCCYCASRPEDLGFRRKQAETRMGWLK